MVTYFAGVPSFQAGQTLGSNIQFYDLKSVQVLKGPQGTLFGRSTTGGAVLIEPQEPTNKLGGYVDAQMTNYNGHDLTGVLNLPIVPEKVMLRLAANITHLDGYSRSLTTGQALDERNRQSYRIGLMLRPFEGLESYILFTGEHIDEAAQALVMLEYNPQLAQFANPANLVIAGFCNGLSAAAFNAAGCGDPNVVATRIARLNALKAELQTEYDRVHNGGSIRENRTSYLDYYRGTTQILQNSTTLRLGQFGPLGEISLKNIFATPRVLRGTSQFEFGVSGNYHGSTNNPFDIVHNQLVATDRTASTSFFQRFTEEFQVAGSSPFMDWIVGYYLEKNHRPYRPPAVFYTFSNAFTVPLDAASYNGQLALERREKFTGLFAQATIRPVEGLSVTAGYRRSTASSRQINAAAVLTPTGAQPNPNGQTIVATPTEKVGTYNFAIDYKATPDLLIYATTRKGYKPGGINLTQANPAPDGFVAIFKPETLQDVEIGAKLRFASGIVNGHVNLALYQQWYKDIQRNQVLPGAPGSGVVSITQINNIAEAKIKGLEFESSTNIGDRFTFTLNYAFTDPKYTNWPGTSGRVQLNSTALVQVPNIQSAYTSTPRHQFTVGARYKLIDTPTVGRVSASADYYHQSTVVLDESAINDPLNVGTQKGWGSLNLRLDWANAAGTGIDAAVFGKNVLNDKHLVGVGNLLTSLGFISGIYSEPAIYGVSLRYKFGS